MMPSSQPLIISSQPTFSVENFHPTYSPTSSPSSTGYTSPTFVPFASLTPTQDTDAQSLEPSLSSSESVNPTIYPTNSNSDAKATVPPTAQSSEFSTLHPTLLNSVNFPQPSQLSVLNPTVAPTSTSFPSNDASDTLTLTPTFQPSNLPISSIAPSLSNTSMSPTTSPTVEPFLTSQTLLRIQLSQVLNDVNYTSFMQNTQFSSQVFTEAVADSIGDFNSSYVIFQRVSSSRLELQSYVVFQVKVINSNARTITIYFKVEFIIEKLGFTDSSYALNYIVDRINLSVLDGRFVGFLRSSAGKFGILGVFMDCVALSPEILSVEVVDLKREANVPTRSLPMYAMILIPVFGFMAVALVVFCLTHFKASSDSVSVSINQKRRRMAYLLDYSRKSNSQVIADQNRIPIDRNFVETVLNDEMETSQRSISLNEVAITGIDNGSLQTSPEIVRERKSNLKSSSIISSLGSKSKSRPIEIKFDKDDHASEVKLTDFVEANNSKESNRNQEPVFVSPTKLRRARFDR